MHKEFLECKTRAQAEKLAPWAAEIIKVEGGYMAFESAAEADMHKGQK